MRRFFLGITLILTVFSLSLSTPTVSASPTLKLNSHGHDVLVLQKKLQTIGYTITSIDGVFGRETERAVAEFQRDNEMKITGVVNNATWRALKKAKERKWGTDVKPPVTIEKDNDATVTTPAKNYVPNGKKILSKSKVNDIIATAKKYIGSPYVFGGTTPKGFDCSGFLQYVFAKNGINIPRTADEQYYLGEKTKSVKQLVPGDLVFFTTYEAGASHCGIYLGGNNFIHTSSSKGVRIDSLKDDYWSPRYYGGKHIVK